MSFRDQVIIVTGASEGIGRALAIELAAQQPRLVLAARNLARLEECASECRQKGAEVLCVATDITDEAACEVLIRATVDRFGKIDALINNAGGTMWTRFEEIQDFSIFDRLMRLNYLGAVYCTRFALPYLKQSRGRLVAVSSVAGMGGVPTRTAYSASKHAMFGFFDSLRIELADSGVSVTMIAPDFVLSEIHRRALGPDGKPLGKSPLDESQVMTSQQCAAQIVIAMRDRKRLLITSGRGKLARWLRLIAPGVVDRIAKKAIAQGH